MDITSTQLRYHTTDVFEALERNEVVNLYRRGKLIGKAMPIGKSKKKKIAAKDHPSFGCIKDDRPIEEIMAEIRKPRFPDLKLKG